MKISKYNSEGYHDPTTYEALSNIEKQRREEHFNRIRQQRPGFRPLVYICSPYSGNIKLNVEAAQRYCRFAVEQNYIPFAPHLLFPQFLDDLNTEERNLAIFMGKVLMSKCAEVWVFGDNISPGMASEIDRAEHHKMPIRYFSSDCIEQGDRNG